jgi:hypothetical protein
VDSQFQMVQKVLRDPFKDRGVGNFSYSCVVNVHNAPTHFTEIGRFISYSTTVAHIVRNELDKRMEVHVDLHRYSSSTDRQLAWLRRALDQNPLYDLYHVPDNHNKAPFFRTDPNLATLIRQRVSLTLKEMVTRPFPFKTYKFKTEQVIDRINGAIHLMTDKVPAEIYNTYFTVVQTHELNWLVARRSFLEPLLINSGGDGRVIKTALAGLMALEGNHE